MIKRLLSNIKIIPLSNLRSFSVCSVDVPFCNGANKYVRAKITKKQTWQGGPEISCCLAGSCVTNFPDSWRFLNSSALSSISGAICHPESLWLVRQRIARWDHSRRPFLKQLKGCVQTWFTVGALIVKAVMLAPSSDAKQHLRMHQGSASLVWKWSCTPKLNVTLSHQLESAALPLFFF